MEKISGWVAGWENISDQMQVVKIVSAQVQVVKTLQKKAHKKTLGFAGRFLAYFTF